MAGDFCSEFFCSTFFCTTTASAIPSGVEIYSGGGAVYIQTRPTLLRRTIPRFTRIIHGIISHKYWVTRKPTWLFTCVITVPTTLQLHIPKIYLVKSAGNISHIYKLIKRIDTHIPTRPHPEVIKTFLKLMKELSKWE